MEQNSDVNNVMDEQTNQNLPENSDGSMNTPESEMMSDDGEENNSMQETEQHKEEMKKETSKVDLPYDVPNDETPPNSEIPKKKTSRYD